MEEIEGVVRELLVTEFKVKELDIAPEASFKQLGLDSLDVVSFVMALEDRLGLEIPESDLEGVTTYGGALDLLERKVGAKA
ncbi:MAG TPA: acyl carrier protein [Actinomycetota bacterium]|nr:acyl carrier protein [Actinomycetota bacterium]